MTAIAATAPDVYASREARQAIVATTDHQARALREDWLRLRDTCGSKSPDAHPDFFLRIYPALGPEVAPYVVALREGSTTNAMIIGRTVRTSVRSRLGYLAARSPALRCLEIVYDGILTDGKAGSWTAVMRFLLGMLAAREVECVRLHHRDDSAAIMQALRSHGFGGVRLVSHPETHMLLELADPQTRQRIEHHSSKTRSTFRREDRRLAERFGGNLELRVLSTAGDAEEFIGTASAISAGTYHAALGIGVHDDRVWRAITGALTETGRLRAYLLIGGGEAVAYMLGGAFDGCCTLMATGYRPEHAALSPGKVLMNRVLAHLATTGVHTVDFGWGEAEYKRLFASIHRQETTLHVYGPGWRSAIACGLERTSSKLSIAIKSAMGLKAVGALRRMWRRRMTVNAAVNSESGNAQ